jgi:hypothetical protein
MIFYNHNYPTQEEHDKFAEEAHIQWNEAKICDYPECHIRAKEVEQMKLCPLCRVATYCCQEHGNLDWLAHRSLCKELRWPE